MAIAHKFETAGLGIAPFRLVRVEMRWFSIPGIPGSKKPGSSCMFCGHPIAECCFLRDANGKEFHVGNECIKKAGDAGLYDTVKKELRRMKNQAEADAAAATFREGRDILARADVRASLSNSASSQFVLCRQGQDNGRLLRVLAAQLPTRHSGKHGWQTARDRSGVDPMTAMQFSLFDARPAAATVGMEPSVNARNAKRQLDTLRKQLATAQADLEDVDYNLSIVVMHQRASREGKIDANWWDAAMRFGMLDPGEEPVYRLGSYPVKGHAVDTAPDLYIERRTPRRSIRHHRP
jgi:hypothetical protein